MCRIRLFYDEGGKGKILIVEDAFKEAFKVKEGAFEEIYINPADVKHAYNARRKQYNASILLDYARKRRGEAVFLWMVSDDIYIEGTNFVFGIAKDGEGAVLSLYRLHTAELIKKEALHEMGHVFGLEHCRNLCVMQFSNSLYEAMMKPAEFCEDCKKLLKIRLKL
ncbi:MAG: archaemetzincin family Zn-dependent metalloprotease [Candidatus Methanospirareceae archaeon]